MACVEEQRVIRSIFATENVLKFVTNNRKESGVVRPAQMHVPKKELSSGFGGRILTYFMVVEMMAGHNSYSRK